MTVGELAERSYRIVYRVRGDVVEALTVFESHHLLPKEDLPPEPKERNDSRLLPRSKPHISADAQLEFRVLVLVPANRN